jgi:cytochrome b561
MTQQASLQYDKLSQMFHWTTAVAVVAAFTLGPEGFGRLMKNGLDPATRLDIVWHESLGMLVLVLTLLRLVWLIFRPPAPKVPQAPWMRHTATATHLGLWLLMLAVPATALLTLGSEGFPLTLLGDVRIDHMPLIADSALGKLADWGDVHEFLGTAIIWLAGIHAAAALFHQWVLNDGVLAAMLPWRRPG